MSHKHLTLCQMYRWIWSVSVNIFLFSWYQTKIMTSSGSSYLLFILWQPWPESYDSQGWQLGPHMVFKFLLWRCFRHQNIYTQGPNCAISGSFWFGFYLNWLTLIANSLMPWGADLLLFIFWSAPYVELELPSELSWLAGASNFKKDWLVQAQCLPA